MKLKNILFILFLFLLWNWYKNRGTGKSIFAKAQNFLSSGASGMSASQKTVVDPVTGEVTIVDIAVMDEQKPGTEPGDTITPTKPPILDTTGSTTTTTTTSDTKPTTTTTEPVKPPQPAPVITTASSSTSKFRAMERASRRQSAFIN
jgi:hypothetical protein